jgi:small conductance mechanosensitive channel
MAIEQYFTSETWFPILLNFAQAIAVLIIGFWVAGFAGRMVKRVALRSETIDDTLGVFLASMTKYAILAIVIIAVLQMFGFEVTSLIAILGAASLAIGLALQGTLSHLAAGVMLVIFRPFKLGDFIDAGGAAGTVEEITLFTTRLISPDNVVKIIPNGDAWGSVITNYSIKDTRRLDVVYGIDYGDDIEKAKSIILKVAGELGLFKNDPAEPWVRVTNLNDSSVDIQFRGWLERGEYWEAKFAMLQQVKTAFDDGGISIPYPHSVEIHKEG